jgi:hypothetical protein
MYVKTRNTWLTIYKTFKKDLILISEPKFILRITFFIQLFGRK